MNNLYRLVYTSFRKPECTKEEIDNILAACKRNNPGRNVTGVLLHSKSRFIQYMEGEKEDVKALYELIQTDPRHTSVNQRNFEPIEKRQFPSWEMGYYDVSGDEISFDSDVTEENKQFFNEVFEGEIDFNDKGTKLLKLFGKS